MNESELLILVGAKIRYYRKQRKLTQDEFSRQCNMDKTAISRIECGRMNCTILTLSRMSEVLKINMDVLFRDM